GGRQRGDLETEAERMHEVARREEFLKPAQRDADRGKLDKWRWVEREHHDDGDRRQEEDEDGDVDREIKYATGAYSLPCGGSAGLRRGALAIPEVRPGGQCA